ncbi:hypothetical protein BHE74_00043274, partial [Ensete ventricosum]
VDPLQRLTSSLEFTRVLTLSIRAVFLAPCCPSTTTHHPSKATQAIPIIA